ncbi:MAG TPA: hypothetical protein VGI75_01265 [Pirellulales bacterium]
MPLDFNCPNGHRIVNCPDERAGREGRCPKCGVIFRIPTVSGGTATPINGATVGGSSLNLSAAQSGNLTRAATGEQNNIVFLCPNGHRLNAPANLEGRAGQCPQCGARFLVPVLGELDEVAEVDLTDLGDQESGPLGTAEFGSTGAPRIHSLCKMMRQLWAAKDDGAIIELHLEGGAMLLPDWFDERLSRAGHGLFAAQAADGTVTMTAVAWDSVMRVVVRNVDGIPEGMFE